ncbi:MAG: lysostaphin resistance A-like protein [Actinomycetota bacterium]
MPGQAVAVAQAPPKADADGRVRLPKRAWGLAASGIVGAFVGSIIGQILAQVIAVNNKVLLTALAQAGLWAGLLLPVMLASKWYGSGSIWRDFGIRRERHDLWRGMGFSVLGRVAGLVLVVPIIALNAKFSGSDVQSITGAKGDWPLYALMIAIALIGAPFVEELYFRGLLLRSLVPLTGTATAIGLQAAIFASMHLKPSYGLGNVSVFLAVGVMGVVQGIIAERYRRLGPAMFSHGIYNLAAVLALIR